MKNKPEIKFHVEDNKIVMSGSGDIMSQDWVAETLTQCFKSVSEYEKEIKERDSKIEFELDAFGGELLMAKPPQIILKVFKEMRKAISKIKDKH